MKLQRPLLLSLLALLLCLPFLALTQSDAKAESPAIVGFKIVQSSSDTARIRVGDTGDFVAVEAGKTYQFPCTIKSERSQIDLELSPGNIARLLPRTVLVLSSAEIRHPKLRLLTGKVALELDQFPKDHKLEVVTPTAVCGAVGTHFEVAYDGQTSIGGEKVDDLTHAQSFKCSKGEVFVAADSFRIGGVKAGLEVAACALPGLQNSFSTVRLQHDGKSESFRIAMAGREDLLASKSTSFQIAQPADKSLSVVKFDDDTLEEEGVLWNSKLGVEAGKAYVQVGDKRVEHAEAAQYLEAARVEGQIDARMRQIAFELEVASPAEKAALEQEQARLTPERAAAAAQATAIAQRFAQHEQIKGMLRKVNDAVRRQTNRSVQQRH